MSLSIQSTINGQPQFDGEMVWYNAGATHSQRLRYGTRNLVHVNGMQNQPDAIQSNGLKLSPIIEGSVLALYNQPSGVPTNTLRKFIQRLRDSTFLNGVTLGGRTFTVRLPLPNPEIIKTPMGGGKAAPTSLTVRVVIPGVPLKEAIIAVLQGMSMFTSFMDDLGQCMREHFVTIWGNLLNATYLIPPTFPDNPAADLIRRVKEETGVQDEVVLLRPYIQAHLRGLLRLFFAGSPAIVALLEFLDTQIDSWFNQNLVLTCHSQGNLIVSSALYGFKVLCMGTNRPFPSRPIHVFAIASPAVSWPGEVTVKCYTHADDIVTWASGGRSYWSVVGGRSKGSTVLTSGKAFASKQGAPDHNFSIYAEGKPLIRDLRAEFGLPPEPKSEQLTLKKELSLPVYKARR